MSAIDWGRMFIPGVSPLEVFLRGTLMYFALFALLRFVVRRETGTLGITDLLVIVLVADAAQNGMAGEYRSVTDGVVLVATIIGWSYVLEVLAFRYPRFRRVVQPPRVKLVHDGRVLHRNLARENITEEELLSEVHAHGCEHFRDVRAAWIEPDGMVSVIKTDSNGADRQQKRRT